MRMIIPNSSFLYVSGKGSRLFQYKDSAGTVDAALVESAIADIPSSELPAAVKARLVTQAKAKGANRGWPKFAPEMLCEPIPAR